MNFSALCSATIQSLRGNWIKSMLITLLSVVICGVVSRIPVAGKFANLLLYPMNIGLLLYFMRLVRRQDRKTADIFQPYLRFFRWLWCCIRMGIFIFLWSLLLIIPGIIACYRYILTPFVLLDNPDMSVKDAMAFSGSLMKGHKARLFGYFLLLGLVYVAMPIIFAAILKLFFSVAGTIVLVAILFMVALLVWQPICLVFFIHFYQSLLSPADSIPASEE